MSEMKQIAQAINNVMKSVRGMEKNSRVGTGGGSYNGTKDQDVKEVFNEQLAKNGLSMMPIDVQEETQIDRWQEEVEWKNKVSIKQKQSVFTKVRTKYLLLHTSGESIELMGYGHGVDAQDKGAGKAMTYAMKNCLLYTFMTPVGKIDDTETTYSDDIEVPQAQPEKAWLNPNTKKWTGVVEKLKSGVSIDEVKKHFKISKENEEKLINEAI